MNNNTSEIDAFAKLIYGGADPAADKSFNTTVVDNVYDSSDVTIEHHKPRITRPIMSKFEFVRVCTAAAKYLYALPDLSQYITTPEVNDLINPAELAFLLIINGKLNATFDRLGYEKVTMSELKINPVWIDMVKHYFDFRHNSEHNEILKAYGLMQK